MYVEEDGDCTLYYTKSHTLNGESHTDGLFMAKASNFKGTQNFSTRSLPPLSFRSDTEKKAHLLARLLTTPKAFTAGITAKWTRTAM